MLDDQELDMLIRSSEESKIERKRGLDLDTQDRRAEFIKDMLCLANAHGPSDAYMLIGIADDGNPVDIAGLKLRDEELQQQVNERVEPRIAFTYQTYQYGGARMGIIEITTARHRPHVVRKDYNETGRTPLRRMDAYIRDGSRKRLVEPWDHVRYQEDYAREVTASAVRPRLEAEINHNLKLLAAYWQELKRVHGPVRTERDSFPRTWQPKWSTQVWYNLMPSLVVALTDAEFAAISSFYSDLETIYSLKEEWVHKEQEIKRLRMEWSVATNQMMRNQLDEQIKDYENRLHEIWKQFTDQYFEMTKAGNPLC